MKGFVDNIQTLTEKSADFRHVLYTGKNLQLVLMVIQPGEEIGEETHKDRDQFFRVEKAKAKSSSMAIARTSKATEPSAPPKPMQKP